MHERTDADPDDHESVEAFLADALGGDPEQYARAADEVDIQPPWEGAVEELEDDEATPRGE